MSNAIRRYERTGNGFKERLIVKTFKYRDDMYKFLSTADNSHFWKEISDGMPDKAGKYAFAGGRWHNVKSLDASVLAHI